MPYHGEYESPTDLLRDDSLNHHEKIEMLNSWRDDKEALLRASDEGMHGNVRLDYLAVIEDALGNGLHRCMNVRNGPDSRPKYSGD